MFPRITGKMHSRIVLRFVDRKIESILKGSEYFKCERHNCRMRKEMCFKRQAQRHQFYDFFPQIEQITYSLEQCAGCEQGKRLAAMEGKRIKPQKSIITRQTQRGNRRDFIKEFPDLGHNNEKELFQELTQTHTLEEIAKMLETCVTTVCQRLKAYGIIKHTGRRKRSFKDAVEKWRAKDEPDLFRILHDREGMSFLKMAEELGCSGDTAHRRYLKAMIKDHLTMRGE